jgi:hypothetical protein
MLGHTLLVEEWWWSLCTSEESVSICNTSMKYVSWKKCCKKLCATYLTSVVLNGRTLYKIVGEFQMRDLLLDKKQPQKHHALAEEKCYNIGAQMEASARKSLHLFTFQFQMSKASPCLTMKPIKPWPN